RDQRAEMGNTLVRPKFARYGVTSTQVRSMLNRIAQRAVIASPVAAWPLPIRDLKDGPILASALGGDAHYLETGDDDHLGLRGDPRLGRLRIVSVRTFLEILGEDEAGNG